MFMSGPPENFTSEYHLVYYSCCEEPYPDITYTIRLTWTAMKDIIHYVTYNNMLQNTTPTNVLCIQLNTSVRLD